jgi:hypothetical protein
MLSPELTRLTRNFHTRPGASPAAIAGWRALVKDVPLPSDYLEFMRFSNGAYGQTGDDGLWIRLDSLEDVLPITRGHRMPDGLLLIGGTRLGDGLALDARSAQTQMVTVSLGWWGAHEVLDPLGPSLETALQALETMGPLPVPWAIRSGPRPDIGFVPTPQPMVEAMLTAADLRPGEMLYDLGCGDGRVVTTAAKKFCARAVGFDLDIELIQIARAAAVAAGVRHSVTFRKADLFTVDLRPADVVSLYLLRDINARLLPQLKQLKPGARVVSYEFDIPGVPAARSALTEYEPGVQGRVLVWDAPF